MNDDITQDARDAGPEQEAPVEDEPAGKEAAPPPPPPPAQTAPPPPPPGGRDHSRPFFFMLLLCFAVGVAHFIVPATPVGHGKDGKPEGIFKSLSALAGGPGVAIIRVDGVIAFSDEESFYPRGARKILEQLKSAEEDDDVKAVVLRINSPGGTLGASQEIHDRVESLIAGGKKVVVSMADMAASGGYYISAPANYVFANPGTLTGSIGVVTQVPEYVGLLDKVGVRFDTFVSGSMKDAGNPFRKRTQPERELFLGIVKGAFEQFLQAVVKGRVLETEQDGRKIVLTSEEEVRKLADGRVYLGTEAIENGLVDELGGLEKAVAKAGELAGLGKDPRIIRIRRGPPIPDFLSLLEMESRSPAGDLQGLLKQFTGGSSSVPVLYLYRP